LPETLADFHPYTCRYIIPNQVGPLAPRQARAPQIVPDLMKLAMEEVEPTREVGRHFAVHAEQKGFPQHHRAGRHPPGIAPQEKAAHFPDWSCGKPVALQIKHPHAGGCRAMDEAHATRLQDGWLTSGASPLDPERLTAETKSMPHI